MGATANKAASRPSGAGLLASMDAALAFAERFCRVTEAVERVRVQGTPFQCLFAAVTRAQVFGVTIAPVPAVGLAALIGCTHAAGAPNDDSALAEARKQPRNDEGT